MNKLGYLLSPLIFWGMTSCGSIKPEAPTNMNKTVELKPIPVAVSSVNIPIKIDMRPFARMADSMTDKVFSGSDNPCEGLRYQYKLERGEFKLDGKGKNKIGLKFDLKYAAKGDYCALCMGSSCSVPTVGFDLGYSGGMKRASIDIESQIEVQNNYRLKTKTEISQIKPIDPIKVMFGYDVTNLLLKQAQPYIKDASKMVDVEISKIDLKKYIEPYYKELQKDIYIDGVGYLALFPKELSISTLTFNKNLMEFSLGIKAAPAIKSTAWNQPVKPLPNLSEYKSNDGFIVYTDLKLDFDSLSKQIMGFLKDQVFEAGSNKIKVTKLRLYPENERMGVEVAFEGSKKGLIYLNGLPVYDSANQEVRVNDLQYDLKTKNVLLKSAKWLLNETIRKKMQESMVVSIAPEIKEAKKSMNEALNQKLDGGVKLNGKVNDIQIRELQVRPDELFIRVRLSGKMGVSM